MIDDDGELVDFELFYCPDCGKIVRGVVLSEPPKERAEGVEIHAKCPFSDTDLSKIVHDKPEVSIQKPRPNPAPTHVSDGWQDKMFERIASRQDKYNDLLTKLREDDSAAASRIGYMDVAEILGHEEYRAYLDLLNRYARRR